MKGKTSTEIQKGKSEQKTSFVRSIKLKVALMVAIAIVCATAFNLSLIVPYVANSLNSLNQNYLLDIANANGLAIENMMAFAGKDKTLSYEELASVFDGVGIKGIESSYAYVVGADGSMLYHPTKEKVGKPVENDLVKGIVADLSKGSRRESDVIEYDFKGVTKYASFYITKNNSTIIVITADKDEILSTTNTVRNRCTISGITATVLFSILSYLFLMFILKPITGITKIIGKMSDLDFTENPEAKKFLKKKDETGVMANAVFELRNELIDTINNIKSQSKVLLATSEQLDTDAKNTTVTMGR